MALIALSLVAPAVAPGRVTAQSNPDPTQLPVATTAQVPLTAAYNALGVPSLAAGRSYRDPTTGVTIYKITSATFPAASNWGHDYSEGGDEISLPYTADGITRAVHVNSWNNTGHYIVDFTPGVGVSNPRRLTGRMQPDADLHFTFSNNPLTPYYVYISDGTGVRRFDIRTMTEAPGDGWPVPSEPGSAWWLHQSENDGLFVWMRGPSGGAGIVAYEPGTGRKLVVTDANSDEPRVDRNGRYIGFSQNSPNNGLSVWDTSTNTVTRWTNGGDPGLPFAHVGSLRDRWMSCDWNTSFPNQYGYFNVTVFNSAIHIPGATSGCGHINGNWIQHPASGSLDDQWAASVMYGGSQTPGGNGFIAPGGILLITPGGQKRLLAHPYNPQSNYSYFSFAKFSPDGRYLMFTSNMNGGGRSDVFLAEMPVSGGGGGGDNPLPVLTGLSPTGANEGGAGFTLTATGTDFVAASVVQWNGSARPTSFVNSTQLRATISAADIATAGTASVRVVSPAPGGGTSAALTFIITPDTTAPTVSITAPSAGASVNGTVTVTATAGDNVGVAGVQFKVDGVNLGAEDTAAPYSRSWNTTGVANGSHTLTAVARDAAGNTTTSADVSVTVANPDTTAPTVSITAPSAGASVNGTVTVTATASDNVGVVGVQFKLDGVNLGAESTAAPYSTSWNTTGVANGSHALTAVARDAAGNTKTSAAVSVTVANPDTTAPTVSITAPSAGASVNGTVTVTATASDNVGVVGVQFKLDGVNLGAEDAAGPYSTSWNTTGVANGSHTLTAVARDAAGNETTSSPITVTVANPALTVTPATVTDFGSANVGTHADRSFTVTNAGGGTLTGTASTAAPFTIVSGAAFSLPAGASATVVVRFTPTTTGPATGAAAFTSNGGSASRGLSGAGIDTTAPAVSVTAPAAGATVSGTVTVAATASDNVRVAGVQFMLDGTNLGAEDTSGPPYTVVWDTTTGADGPHVLAAVARDAAGNVTTATAVTVTVVNQALAVTPAVDVDFGSVTVGATLDRTFTVTNRGLAPLAGTATAAAPFMVVSGGTFTLTPGASTAVMVRFVPAARGPATGSVTFSSSGGTSVRGLAGNGIPPLRTLTLTRRGTGSGRLTSAAPLLDCGATCSVKVTDGTAIVLQATAAASSTFIGWNGVCSGTASTCSVTMDADKTAGADFTLLSVVTFSAATYTVSEPGRAATITVTRSGGTHAGVSVDVMTGDGTARAGVDYTAVAQSLTFAAGQTSASVTVPVTDDTVVNGARTVTLALSNLQGLAVLGARPTALLTIADNDLGGTIQFSARGYSIAERADTPTTAVIRVTRSGGAASGVTVDLATTDGTARAGVDYVASTQTLTFGAGETFKDVAITILPDTVVEGDETLGVVLSNPTGGARLGALAAATVTILDAQVGVQFSAPVYRANETGGSATITVVRTGPVTGTTTVWYATSDGTALAGVDYTATAGVLTFAPGARTRTFTVPLRDDTVVDGVRTVLLELGAVTNGTVGPQHTAVLTLNDNDAGGALRFSAPAYSIRERAGIATITVVRTGGAASAVTVAYATSDGTGIAGTDYLATAGILSFGPGQMSRTFTVAVRDDAHLNGPRTVNLALSTPTGGATLGAVASAVLTIVDDDAGGLLRFSAASYRVSEGGLATIAVLRAAGAADGVTVSYATADETAVAGVDYTTAAGTLTFEAGEMLKTFTVQTAALSGASRDRSLVLTLSAPTGGAGLAGPSVARLTIEDTTTALEFSAATYAVGEARGSVAVTVRRSGPLAGTSTVRYTTADGGATAGTDYTASSGILTFSPGVAARTIAIAVRNTTGVDGDRTILLALSDPVGAVLGAQNTAQVHIVDDDGPGTLQFSTATSRVVEGGTAALTVLRTAGLGGTVLVPYSITPGTATAGVDYVASSGFLTFGPGVVSRTLTVQIIGNTVVDGDRTVVVSLGTPTGGATLGTPTSAVLTIADNDAGGVIRFSATTYKVTEGGIATITVLRASGAASGVTVQYAAAGGGTAANGTLTFGPGQTAQTFKIQTVGDALTQGDRTVALTLTGPTGGATLGTPATAVLTIVDDDPKLRFSQPAYRVAEGATATITVLRAGLGAGTVTVNYTVELITASAADVQGPLSGTLTFGPGVMSRTFTVATKPDTLAEGDETLRLTLSGPVGASLDTPSTSVLTIGDDDAAGTVQWSSAAYSAPQTSGGVMVAITRSGGAASDVTVSYRTQDGTASAGANYEATSGTVTFAAGETTKMIWVPIFATGPLPLPITFTLVLSDPTGRAALGAPSSSLVFILDH